MLVHEIRHYDTDPGTTSLYKTRVLLPQVPNQGRRT